MNISDLGDRLASGERRALSQAITLIESNRHDHRELASELLNTLLPKTGASIRVGITGVPGVGKSTFIDSFGSNLLNLGHKIAVLAVDPSSSRTKGSILGDKTRMPRLSSDARCFVRPSPTRGELGGVASMTREVMLLTEAAGFDVVLVETVGVGQSENAVCDMVDFFMALMLPGAGDELQGIKKGLIELADLIVVNKADGKNQKPAEFAAQQYRRALEIIEPKDNSWQPKVRLASGLNEAGLDEIWSDINCRIESLNSTGGLERLRLEQDLNWMKIDFKRRLLNYFELKSTMRATHKKLEKEVLNRKITPTFAAQQLLASALEER